LNFIKEFPIQRYGNMREKVRATREILQEVEILEEERKYLKNVFILKCEANKFQSQKVHNEEDPFDIPLQTLSKFS
jgi:hypothetical protein